MTLSADDEKASDAYHQKRAFANNQYIAGSRDAFDLGRHRACGHPLDAVDLALLGESLQVFDAYCAIAACLLKLH